MPLSTGFAERLLQARRQRGLEQQALADLVGLTRWTYGRLERGEATQINIESLRQLVRFLGVSADWLLAIDQLPTVTPDPDPYTTPHDRFPAKVAGSEGHSAPTKEHHGEYSPFFPPATP